ncbi:MAG: alpha/beta hydrolase [Alphaproteobacteria bacterium]|nr:alpha/beta hydrolase [Alphaproteobacteria bacterium]MCB9796094.1 alpha/beta hydrolase [Alphaproteobacteria bacterium]
MTPFQRLPFDQLPETPRRPHPFSSLPVEVVELDSAWCGPARLALRRFGQGPPLLLVHGLMTSGYSWRYVLELLGARYTLLIPDLPGNGDSEPVLRAPYTPEGLATLLGELQAALGVRGCPVVGNSMGGMLCMRWALDDPEAMSALVNLHSPGPPTPRLHALRLALSLPGAPALTAWMAGLDPERWVWRNVHYHDESLKSREETRVYGAPLRTPEGARAFVAYLRDAMNTAGLQRLVDALKHRRDGGQRFPVPLQLVYATTDPMVPPAAGHALSALIPDAPITWLEGSSHFMHVDTPEATAAEILGFLAEVTPG